MKFKKISCHSSLTMFPQNDDFGLGLANECSCDLSASECLSRACDECKEKAVLLLHSSKFQFLKKLNPKFIPFANAATQIDRSSNSRKAAFTLAEVLITLGIIGVVAALTIPNLVGKYRIKTFETGFKKTDAIIQNAIYLAKNDLGIDDFAKTIVVYDFDTNKFINSEELRSKFKENLNTVPKPGSKKYDYPNIRNFTNTNYGINAPGFGFSSPFFLADGSIVMMVPNAALMFVYFDTNGLKPPNRFGYDVFIYSTNTDKGMIYREEELKKKCSFTSTDVYNGYYCYQFARANQNPEDITKTYWESLKW